MFKRFALLSLVLSIVVNPVFATDLGETDTSCDEIAGNVDSSTGTSSTSGTSSGPTVGGN